jgi:uncharacterized repeat protein (TIGR03803 family)
MTKPDAPPLSHVDQLDMPLGRRWALIGWATAMAIGMLSSSGMADAQGSYAVLHHFNGAPGDGANPRAGVIQATDGNFYGTTRDGGGADTGLICNGIGCGTVFQMTAEGTVTVVHAFAGSDAVGAPHPDASLVQAGDGFLYGTTVFGGGAGCEGIGCGTMFRVATDGSGFAVLHTFLGGPGDGAHPAATLLLATDGFLYGTTRAGGGAECGASGGCGTLFRVAIDGSHYAVLHTFTGGATDGAIPGAGALLQATDGSLYGTTANGGGSGCHAPGGCGILFRMAVDGTGYAVLRRFTGGPTDGASPNGLTQATDGFLYGTTAAGGGSGCNGPLGCGTLFRMAPDGTGYAVLHLFTGVSGNDGFGPAAALIQATDGSLYGTTEFGGVCALSLLNEGCGTLFTVTPAGSYAVLHSFTLDPADGADGAYPLARLLQARDGRFYGTAFNDGSTHDGVVFRLAIASLPPTITAQPASQTITAGATATLSVTASGTAPLSYQWYIGAGPGVPTNPIGGATASSYTTPALTITTSYWVQVSNGAGIADSIAVTITVPPAPAPPAITIQPANQTIVSGAVATLSVTASGTAPLNYQWYIGASGTPTNPIGGATGSSYTTPALRSTTIYWVRVSSSAGAADSSTAAVIVRATVVNDFDGDGKTDLTVWQPSTGTWDIRYSSLGYSIAGAGMFQWGLPGDVPIAADFDGDGQTDLAVWRPSTGTWFIRYSSLGYSIASADIFQWGLPGDVPIAGDFDGDGKTDLAVWRPSTGTWFIRYSSLGYSIPGAGMFQWGLPGDIPIAGDFDGDGRTELAVWRPSNGTWYLRYSSLGYLIASAGMFQWGLPGDLPIAGDFDGDGKTDFAVWRPWNGTWYIRYSSLAYTIAAASATQWGLPGDVPVPGDFDGDGKTDLATFRPSSRVWYFGESAPSPAPTPTSAPGLAGHAVRP